MVLFPHAKINLGLQVIKKREDGYHNIISCLYPIQWCDVLEILESNELDFSSSGIEIPGDPNDNLCLKAYHAIKDAYDIPPVQIHLHKAIPMGAGLGGGSSDAAHVLTALNEMFELSLTAPELQAMASSLGSDCPFFFYHTPALVTGTGNHLAPMELDLPSVFLMVVTPPIHINTAQAYQMLTPKPPQSELRISLSGDIASWSKSVINDFEQPLFKKYPKLDQVKNLLKTQGAIYASLSGSGSSVFGIFEEEPQADSWFGQDHLVWVQEL